MPEREKLIDMLYLMYRIRYFETRIRTLYDYQSYRRKGDIAADDYDFESIYLHLTSELRSAIIFRIHSIIPAQLARQLMKSQKAGSCNPEGGLSK